MQPAEHPWANELTPAMRAEAISEARAGNLKWRKALDDRGIAWRGETSR
jgi:hypothetical protein